MTYLEKLRALYGTNLGFFAVAGNALLRLMIEREERRLQSRRETLQ